MRHLPNQIRQKPAVETQQIGFLLLPNFPLMSYASAIEPLRAANVLAGRELYAWSNLTIDGEAVEASVGVRIAPDLTLESAGGLDTLFVCAGGNPANFDHKPTFARLRALAARRRRHRRHVGRRLYSCPRGFA